MRAGFDKWWLLPFGVLISAALVALGIVVFQPASAERSLAEADRQASSEPDAPREPDASSEPDAPREPDASSEPVVPSEPAAPSKAVAARDPAADCRGALSTDYACLQERYRALVHDSGVQAAFAELRGELATNEFVRTNCHQMTHVIGRAAAEVYGDIAGTYSQGDSFCGSGYYHGAMETIVANVDPDEILEEAGTLCADLGGRPQYSLFHYNCAHGLGHGFMVIQDNELFDSLETCDTLADSWEVNRCYGGVFMENVITRNNPSHPSKYLKADQPLYPCDVVGDRYKNECYQRQSAYALETQGNDFAGVFELCTGVESEFRPACYQGLGWDASVQSIKRGSGDVTISESTRTLCMLGEDYEARSNCVVGAVEYFIRDRYDDTLARAFCDTLGADLRAGCLQEAEEYYRGLQPPSERRT